MASPLELASVNLRYSAMIGVGGIGAGQFFALEGNRTLGREESRGGRFLDQRDYCKLHIVSHYVSVLLNDEFSTLPIGKVGNDEVGFRLLDEMKQAGIHLQYIELAADVPTLFSFCLLYPDGTGGNLTTVDSASSRVDASSIKRAEEDFRQHRGAGIALALPEVPLAARRALLEMGTRYEFFRVASFTSEEIVAVMQSGLIQTLDLLSINQHEAATLLGSVAGRVALSEILDATVAQLSDVNPNLQLILTAGSQGSWSWDGVQRRHIPAVSVNVVNSAGAGDAYLAGTIVGLAASLPLFQAQELGNLIAALSATCRHTIDFGIDRNRLAGFVRKHHIQLSAELNQILGIKPGR